MRRRTLLSASIGLGSLAGLSYGTQQHGPRHGLLHCSGAGKAFGTTVGIQVLHPDRDLAQAAIKEALQRVGQVDALMSVHQERSQVYQLNRRGHLDHPHQHVQRVLSQAQQLSLLTEGAFDITVQPLWLAFKEASARAQLPNPPELAKARSLVNWRQVELGARQVRLQSPGMAITLNGLAQGYALDLALAALRAHGIEHALLDTGEFGAIGTKERGQAWMLGIRHPRQEHALSGRVALDGRQVATSGDYETFFTPDHVHHHIFDPASGDSPTTLASATVLAPSGIMADGLSTAFMVMGAERALALATRLPRVDALLIQKDGMIRKTPGFPALTV